MQDLLLLNYEWIRALHIIAVIAWMAGMLYLPRLFVYHADVETGAEPSETFKVMERKLLKVIMNPAMMATWLFGILMFWANPALMTEGWMHVKLLGIFAMTGLHGYFSKTVKVFAADANEKDHKFYRWANEAPTLAMIVIVIMAVVQPF